MVAEDSAWPVAIAYWRWNRTQWSSNGMLLRCGSFQNWCAVRRNDGRAIFIELKVASANIARKVKC